MWCYLKFFTLDNEESQEKKLENGVVPGPGIDLEFETDGKFMVFKSISTRVPYVINPKHVIGYRFPICLCSSSSWLESVSILDTITNCILPMNNILILVSIIRW